jgi:hypothetical protein
MEFALVHNNQLILGPIRFNVRMINSELEDLELRDRISPKSYLHVPIHFSDGITHLLPIERVIPENDSKYHNIGNFIWEIVTEKLSNDVSVTDDDSVNMKVGEDGEVVYSYGTFADIDVPAKVVFTHTITNKTLEEVKALRKQEVAPYRREKENTTITLIVNDTEVKVSTSREERLMLASKLSASPGPHNFKFENTWLEITTEQLQYIVSEVDKVVQEAFDWELAKLQEIDACLTIDEVHDVIVREVSEELEGLGEFQIPIEE